MTSLGSGKGSQALRLICLVLEQDLRLSENGLPDGARGKSAGKDWKLPRLKLFLDGDGSDIRRPNRGAPGSGGSQDGNCHEHGI